MKTINSLNCYFALIFLLSVSFLSSAHAGVIGCNANPEKKTKILFLSNRPGGKQRKNWDLYETDIASRQTTRLTDIPGTSIRWFDKDPTRQRVVIAASTRGNLAIGPSGKDGGPADAEEIIAILERGNKTPNILVDLRPNGFNPKKFTSVWHPTFSPDGQRIVFSASKQRESNNLWIMNQDGSQLRRIFAEPNRTQNDPRFAPNGKIAYIRHDKKGLQQLSNRDLFDVWLIDPDNPRDNQRLSNEPRIPGVSLTEFDPAISPDCRHVAMIRAAEPIGLKSLWRPFSANAIMSTNGQASGFRLMQSGLNPGRSHGVPTWIDNETILSYRRERKVKGWRIIVYNITDDDRDVTVLNLGAPYGHSDLSPIAY